MHSTLWVRRLMRQWTRFSAEGDRGSVLFHDFSGQFPAKPMA